MGAETIMVGAAIFSFFLIYAMTKLDDKHWPLKIFMLFFSIFSMMILSQSVSLGSQDCSWLVSNSTVSGSTTTYEYGYECEALSGNPDQTLFGIVFWFFIISIIYSFLFILYLLIKVFRNYLKTGGFKRP